MQERPGILRNLGRAPATIEDVAQHSQSSRVSGMLGTFARIVRFWTWPRIAVTAWVVVCLGIAVYSYLQPRRHSLFPIYAAATRSWWTVTSIRVPPRSKLSAS